MNLEEEFRALHRFNETDADRSGDRGTLLRAYSRRLYYLEPAGDGWRFPTAPMQADDATLRAAAERAAAEALGPEHEMFMFGNAPVGHVGDKHFFFYGEIVWKTGQLLPDVTGQTAAKGSVWVTRDELSEYLDGQVLECAEKMLAHV